LYRDLTILCIEDEAGVRRRIVGTLKYYFKEVFEASNGKEGFESYRLNRPNIILCDIQMPVMDGIEMIKLIRDEDIVTPIILLTAYSSEEYLMKLINLQVQHFILKPVNTKSLQEGLKKALIGRHTGEIRLDKNSFLNIDNSILQVDKTRVTLSAREAKFLVLLSQNRVIYYDEIQNELWRDKSMSADALKSFIRDLRKKIPIDFIENIPQIGYKLLHV